ncbi:MAG: sigma-70 family RNA polymerase sigma factor [Planctomycetota bacterium]
MVVPRTRSRAITGTWKKAVVDLVASHGGVHFRRARRIVGDPGVAEDVCQQAYLKAVAAEAEVRDPGRLAGWVGRVIVNEAIDVLRRRKRQRRAYETRGESGGRVAGAEGVAESAEERDLVLAMVKRLDEPIRVVVVMRTMQGMTGNEVSRALGCSPALVSRRLHRGLDQLRRWMEESPLRELSAP